jgi:hypothetical protein
MTTFAAPSRVEAGRAASIPSAYWLLGCLALFLVLWLPRLLWGFWTDEAGTFWMANEGPLRAIEKASVFPGQSSIYAVLESMFWRPGSYQEILLRVPSVAGAWAAAWFLYLLAERILGRGCGWLAVIPFVCDPTVIWFATEARPYSLALAASLGSFVTLHEWLETRLSRWLGAYTLFAILTIQLHYVFAFIFVIQFIYLVARRSDVRWGSLLVAAGVVALSSVPLLGSLRLLGKSASTFVTAAPPTLSQLLQLVLPVRALVPIAIACLVLICLLKSPTARWVGLSAPATLLLWTWLLLPPILFFVISVTTPVTLFASRYLLFSVPPAFLLIARALTVIQRPAARVSVVMSVAVATVLNPGTLAQFGGMGPLEWRAPIRLAAELSNDRTTPWIVQSALIQSTFEDWKAGTDKRSFLFSPLQVYPVQNRVIPVPWHFNDSVKQLVLDSLHQEPRLLLLVRYDAEVTAWLTEYLEKLGYRKTVHPVNIFTVVEFQR